MRYLGLNFVCGFSSVGIYDSKSNQFEVKKFITPPEYLQLYKRSPNYWRFWKVRNLYRNNIEALLQEISYRDCDHVTLTDFFGSKPSLSLVPYFEKKFQNKPLLRSDHKWGHINAVKVHPKFQYPALVADCSAQHSVIAYLPDPETIQIVYESDERAEGVFWGLGKVIIQGWVRGAQEGNQWTYDLYAKRGKNGQIVREFSEEVEKSQLPFCEDVLTKNLPQQMEAIKKQYSDLDSYRNDWVATQQALLRTIFLKLKRQLTSQIEAKTYFIGGGISRNPAFLELGEWLKVPDEVGGDDGSGCFMAYLGYHVNEKGLNIKHDRWRGFLTGY
jgi:tRNA A37 threonylcarbamoyltransferase TsaD